MQAASACLASCSWVWGAAPKPPQLLLASAATQAAHAAAAGTAAAACLEGLHSTLTVQTHNTLLRSMWQDTLRHLALLMQHMQRLKAAKMANTVMLSTFWCRRHCLSLSR
jgi:hypothetical protein